MVAHGCTIVIEPLATGGFRARCTFLPDCEAIAPTEEEARHSVELAIEHYLRRQQPSMNLIETLFQQLRARGRKAFIPFVTAGDPDLATTAQVVHKLADSGANLIEIGFPYSDPIADGPVIQASYTRALDRGLKIDQLFATVRQLADALAPRGIPLVGMVSYSLVHRRGAEAFLEKAQDAGLSGAIVPDLPIDEADDLSRLAAARDFKLIHLVTPTTPPERAVRIAKLSTGFLYCVSVTGITGERDRLPDQVLDQLRRLRRETDIPLCVGFGISKPEHVKMLREEVDGIIVGSAIVRRVGTIGPRPAAEVIDEVGRLTADLVTALN
jgi:tryptophan synthase alpha chain